MKLNVIIIDDSAVQLALASKLIKKNKNLNLVGAYSDPFLGLNVVNNEKVDLVLLDVEMPEIDGFSLQNLFKESVAVIINSTRAFFEFQAYVNGAIDFLQKPLNQSKIELAVQRVLKSKQNAADEAAGLATIAS